MRAHLHQLERDLGAAGDLVGELPGGLLDEGGERVVQRAVVHDAPVRRGRRRSSRAGTGARTECKQRCQPRGGQAAATASGTSGASLQVPAAPSHSVP